MLEKRKMKKTIIYALLGLYYIIAGFIYAGWIFHHSDKPQIFIYSYNHIVFLLLLSIFFIFPIIVLKVIKRLCLKTLLYNIVPTLGFIIILYSVLSIIYYNRQVHSFDPFLQMPSSFIRDFPLAGTGTDAIKIMTLGGSTTKSYHLKPAERYDAILGGLLKEHYSPANIEVINAAEPWYTVKHSLISYVTTGKDYYPDLILVMHGINDLYRSFTPPSLTLGRYKEQWTHYYGPSINGAKPPTFEKYLFNRINVGVIQKLTENWYSDYRFKEVDVPLDRFVSIRMFERHLRTLVKTVKTDNALIILVTQPYLYKDKLYSEEKRALVFAKSFCYTPRPLWGRAYPNAQSMHRAMRAYQQVIKKVAAEENVPLLDVEQMLPKTLEYFIDDVHYTPKGCEQYSRCVFNSLVELGIIDSLANTKNR